MKRIAVISMKTEIVHPSRNYIEIVHQQNINLVCEPNINITDKYNYTLKKEIIRLHPFINEYGEEVMIGFSKQVEDTIGFTIDIFSNMQKTISDLKYEKEVIDVKTKQYKSLYESEKLKSERLEKIIYKIKSMPIMKRVFNFII